METAFRRDLVAWLRADPVLAAGLNAIAEESPVAASPPWLGIAASAATGWGAKGTPGREVRVALELICRDSEPDAAAELAQAVERRIATLPPDRASGARVVLSSFLRSRAERRPGHIRAVLIEYRFLLLAAPV